MNRKEQKTHTTLLKQRDEARADAEKARGDWASVRGQVDALVAVETDKVRRSAQERVDAVSGGRNSDLRELTAARFAMSEIGVDEGALPDLIRALRVKHGKHDELLRSAVAAKAAEAVSTIAKLAVELSSIKAEDTKTLRKRLQAKTEQITSLEARLHAAQTEIAGRTCVAVPRKVLDVVVAKVRAIPRGGDAEVAEILGLLGVKEPPEVARSILRIGYPTGSAVG